MSWKRICRLGETVEFADGIAVDACTVAFDGPRDDAENIVRQYADHGIEYAANFVDRTIVLYDSVRQMIFIVNGPFGHGSPYVCVEEDGGGGVVVERVPSPGSLALRPGQYKRFVQDAASSGGAWKRDGGGTYYVLPPTVIIGVKSYHYWAKFLKQAIYEAVKHVCWTADKFVCFLDETQTRSSCILYKWIKTFLNQYFDDADRYDDSGYDRYLETYSIGIQTEFDVDATTQHTHLHTTRQRRLKQLCDHVQKTVGKCVLLHSGGLAEILGWDVDAADMYMYDSIVRQKIGGFFHGTDPTTWFEYPFFNRTFVQWVFMIPLEIRYKYRHDLVGS
jgi:hypothetical protein